ncbi:hypothetical protein PV664_34005 [Streptomyces sp. ME01-18a]|nr:hypothetical protein [Streptomyces sp. ME01-18a]MDX3433899.1 hypothetical protein [Streptomyces sp. ME01-18a]
MAERGKPPGDGLDGVVYVLAEAVVTGESPPVLEAPDAVIDVKVT